MVRYFASDIIKRAMQLSDLENSDFISWSEKLALLNESYQKIYQAGINKDTNAFVRYINTGKNEIQLPPDFYQLKAVTLSRGAFIEQVLRRPANQSLTNLSYDIINNVLKINGNTFGASICVEYYPIPSTLTFPSETKELPVSNVVDMRGRIYVSVDPDSNIVSIGDVTTGEGMEIDEETPELYEYKLHLNGDYAIFLNSTTTTKKLFNYSTGVLSDITKPVVVYKEKTFLLDDGDLVFPDTEAVAYTAGEDIKVELPVIQDGVTFLNDKLDKYAVWKAGTGVITDWKGNVTTKKSISKVLNYCDALYMSSDSDYTAVYTYDKGIISETLHKNTVVKFTDFNDNTGYGILTKRMFGAGKQLESYMDDTELNFPNNIYFVYMSYILAMAFRNKQGADIGQLSALAADAELQFYDALPRDDWGLSRITNAY